MNPGMRLRAAAERLAGARFCSSVRRSSSTFTAASAADHHHHVSNSVEPRIYLCFRENILSTSYVVRRMELNNGGELAVEGYKTFEYNIGVFRNHPHCTTLGSEIIFPVHSDEDGMREICWTDTAKRPMKLRVSKDKYSEYELLTDKDVKYISLPKPSTEKMKIGVIGNQLYSLDLVSKQLFNMCPSGNQFFDPYFNKFVSFSSGGRHVAAFAKVIYDYSGIRARSGWQDAVFFSESEKILATSCLGTYCFDVKNPENGWREVNHPCFRRLGLSKALVIHNYHPDIGNFNLVFTVYSELDLKPRRVEVLFMSNDFDSAHPIEHLIEMPKMYSQYLYATGAYSFVHLGAQRFGVLLNTYKWSRFLNEEEHNIYLLTYEYDTIVNPASGEDKSRPNVDIRSRFLGAKVFTYKTLEQPNRFTNSEVELIGASFMLQSTKV